MDNLIMLPTGKTFVHHYPKKAGPGIIDFVWNNINQLEPEQKKVLGKRIKLAEQILKYLPADKKQLLEQYDGLFAEDTMLIVDKAIKWTLEHEAEVKEEWCL